MKTGMDNKTKNIIGMNNSLGCGRKINAGVCGVANAWGEEYLCKECDKKLRMKWNDEDRKMWEKREKYLKSKGGNK